MERSTTTLLVRHLPKELTDQEKIDLICHFGADRVRPMGTKGSMKHTAFAQFDNTLAVERSIKRLHQLEVLGSKLVVEYAKLSDQNNFPSQLELKKEKQGENRQENTGKLLNKTEPAINNANINITADEIYKRYSIQYPRKPNLHYLYPPPSVSTLTNIANALASHPRFYVQVLHLMNKLNIPAPFGVVTPSPPLASDTRPLERSDAADFENSSGQIEEVEMEYTSTEESEISDETSRDAQKVQEIVPKQKVKRPRKKMKLVKPDTSIQVKPSVVTTPREVFEQPQHVKTGPIQFNLTAVGNPTITPQTQPEIGRINPECSLGEDNMETVTQDGFGKIEPKPKLNLKEEVLKTDMNYKIDPAKFLTYETIREGRLTKKQLKDFSVFKKYSAGEPTCRLYIKNLTKHTTEQDIVNLFGSYIDWLQEISYNSFDVRVMKEGRMKGQAFVSLPNEDCAKKILSDCNGYVINGKPMVIQFARSAKADRKSVV